MYMMRNKETDMALEKRIETAIAENTDPFTTDADIRFFETEEWNAEKATLGAIKYYRYLLRTDASYDRIKEARSEILALEGTV
jgi:hypothetical protein